MERRSGPGASSILGILMILAITLVLAGAVVFVVFQYMNWKTDPVDSYLFTAELKGSDDSLKIELIEGSLNSSRMIVRLDGISLNHTSEMIGPGETYSIPAGFDIVVGHTYQIVIVVDDKVMYDNEVTAKP